HRLVGWPTIPRIIAGKEVVEIDVDAESKCRQPSGCTRRNGHPGIVIWCVDRGPDGRSELRRDTLYTITSLSQLIEQAMQVVLEGRARRQPAVKRPSAVRPACSRVRLMLVPAQPCNCWLDPHDGGHGFKVIAEVEHSKENVDLSSAQLVHPTSVPISSD